MSSFYHYCIHPCCSGKVLQSFDPPFFQPTTQETHQKCSSFLTSAPSTIIPVDVALPKPCKRHTLFWQWIFPFNNKRQIKEDTSLQLIKKAHPCRLQQEGYQSMGCVQKNQRKLHHQEFLISGGKKRNWRLSWTHLTDNLQYCWNGWDVLKSKYQYF